MDELLVSKETQNSLRIYVFEDDPGVISDLRFNVENFWGHKIVGVASTIEKAKFVIPSLGNLGVQAAIIDANLSGLKHTGHGTQICKLIKEQHPNINLVGYGAEAFSGADYWVGKASGPKVLEDTLSKISSSI
ncbi:MAG TPA: hypothetical protein PKU78_00520 [Candidatus Dojkabacteria bacterium]|nr:hypothetical protein [Candidatus Dojkabacteria bacterium]HRO64689.1 hypothetical protein [Candidatus Dojkabacteria bacterium]HRP36686.1 hypothetical protein [Candidatus Dojkabacteria bacterium]HRP50711.1 hypothetical protein [Candidatus Dojkabacteria bacterium]